MTEFKNMKIHCRTPQEFDDIICLLIEMGYTKYKSPSLSLEELPYCTYLFADSNGMATYSESELVFEYNSNPEYIYDHDVGFVPKKIGGVDQEDVTITYEDVVDYSVHTGLSLKFYDNMAVSTYHQVNDSMDTIHRNELKNNIKEFLANKDERVKLQEELEKKQKELDELKARLGGLI